jgi:hypothetical protein
MSDTTEAGRPAPDWQTPEERRDEQIAILVEAGLVVQGSHPLADSADPHVIVAYRLDVLEPTRRTRYRLDELEAATAVDVAAELIDWTPAPVEPADPDAVIPQPTED